jgi:hypothetical protein
VARVIPRRTDKNTRGIRSRKKIWPAIGSETRVPGAVNPGCGYRPRRRAAAVAAKSAAERRINSSPVLFLVRVF